MEIEPELIDILRRFQISLAKLDAEELLAFSEILHNLPEDEIVRQGPLLSDVIFLADRLQKQQKIISDRKIYQEGLINPISRNRQWWMLHAANLYTTQPQHDGDPSELVTSWKEVLNSSFADDPLIMSIVLNGILKQSKTSPREEPHPCIELFCSFINLHLKKPTASTVRTIILTLLKISDNDLASIHQPAKIFLKLENLLNDKNLFFEIDKNFYLEKLENVRHRFLERVIV
jgi:hypothetical protein